ncbi:MAG: hypothetical protein KBB79_02350 [Candidatus Omnitrophica bacterium]|nr:hypothetical protein [Candidatus Omnitrophota bacterium]
MLAFDYLLKGKISHNTECFYSDLKSRIITPGVLPGSNKFLRDEDQIRRSMYNAWGTEFLIISSMHFISEDELIRISNNWNCIQTYYVFYHCTQALLVAKGQLRPDSHPKTQSAFCALWAERPIILPPWSLAFSHKGPINISDEVKIDLDIHPWATFSKEQAWSIAIKSLKTTRLDYLADRIKDKREEKRRQNRNEWKKKETIRISNGRKQRKNPKFPLPQLTEEEKNKIFDSLRPYTLMDYLYRLRIKTNYEDSNMFTEGPQDKESSRIVRGCFCRIASGTLFLHELMLCSLLGPDKFKKWAEEWVKANVPQGMEGGLRDRIKHYT